MISYSEIILRLALAALLAGFIGVDRERLAWAAGLRTHMLVSVGAALFMLVSAYGFGDALHQSGNVRLDVSRVASQVVSGIGFLGAGTIMLRRQIIHGLTTAASLWSVAAIGLAAGGGMYVASIGATVLILVILVAIKPLESRMRSARQTWQITLEVESPVCSLEKIRTVVESSGLKFEDLSIKSAPGRSKDEVRINIGQADTALLDKALDKLRALPGIHHVAIEGSVRH